MEKKTFYLTCERTWVYDMLIFAAGILGFVDKPLRHARLHLGGSQTGGNGGGVLPDVIHDTSPFSVCFVSKYHRMQKF